MLNRRSFLLAGAALPLVPYLPIDSKWHDIGDLAHSNSSSIDEAATTALRHSGDVDYRVTSYRLIEDLPVGSYVLRARSRSSGGQSASFAFAKTDSYSPARTHLLPDTEGRELTIPGIPVTDGKVIIGLHSEAGANQWAELSDVVLGREDSARPFLAGGDVSVLSWLEAAGARFYDRQGTPGDALQILRDAGHSIVRLRLYEAPGPGHGADGYYWPAGCMDLPDVLGLARRAAALGMQIQLSLHYSDFWTNGALQRLPVQWADELRTIRGQDRKLAKLCRVLHERTRTILAAFKQQRTPPQFVSLGNEIQGGILYPFGAASDENWPRLAQLLRAAQSAVKAELPNARVVLHLDDAGHIQKYRSWFDRALAEGVQFDVIGASYYPFWARKTVSELLGFCGEVTERYQRDLLIMETGFTFAPRLPSGLPGQLANNGPYPIEMSSPEGQSRFIDELFNSLKTSPRVVGALYWDPIMIECPEVGWAMRESDGKAAPNPVSNATLFDFSGKALPVLDVWFQHAAAMMCAPR